MDSTIAALPGLAGWQGLSRATAASIAATQAREPQPAAWAHAVAPALPSRGLLLQAA